MSEKRTRLNVVKVERSCSMHGCDGLMVSTGEAPTNSCPPLHPHKCSQCEREYDYRFIYPRIDYVNADDMVGRRIRHRAGLWIGTIKEESKDHIGVVWDGLESISGYPKTSIGQSDTDAIELLGEVAQ